jgi:uncharacterized membrane protein YhaH (DUF805 family)
MDLLTFSGRMGRFAYLTAQLSLFAVLACIAVPLGLLSDALGLRAEARLALFTPVVLVWLFLYVRITVLRLHDIRTRGFGFLALGIPFVQFVVYAVLLLWRGTRGPNQFGPDPTQFSLRQQLLKPPCEIDDLDIPDGSPRLSDMAAESGAAAGRPTPSKTDPEYVLCGGCGFQQWKGHARCQKCNVQLAEE